MKKLLNTENAWFDIICAGCEQLEQQLTGAAALKTFKNYWYGVKSLANFSVADQANLKI